MRASQVHRRCAAIDGRSTITAIASSLLLASCSDGAVVARDAAGDRATLDDRASVDAHEDTRGMDGVSQVDAAREAGEDAGSVDGATDAGRASCEGRAFGERCADGLVCDGRGACALRRPCRFESAGRWLYPTGATRRLLETVFAYGRYYNFWINADGSFETLEGGSGVTASVDRWRGARQACDGSDPCSFDSFDLYELSGADGSRVIAESITRLGRYFNYSSEGGYRLVQSGFLHEVPRYSEAVEGPCFGQVEGACRFDTRSLVVDWSTGAIVREEITARGRRWVFDGEGRPVPSVMLGQALNAVARYAPSDGAGPCAGRGVCQFDAQFHDPSNGDEYVVAYGKLWVWASDAENTRRYVAGYANELHTFGRYASGPCRVSP
jgi:hypothetical protein